MTRVNLVPVEELSDQHLLAEHREIKRIPNVILSGRYNLFGIPSQYTMGTGHVKFFYNKLTFLVVRYEALYKECLYRGFNVQNYIESFIEAILNSGQPLTVWVPTLEELEISRQRIRDKLEAKPDFYRWTKREGIKFLSE